MATTNGKRGLIGMAVGLVVVAAVGVGAVVHYADRGRATQLQTDEMGRQRDAVNAAAHAKTGATTTTSDVPK